MKLINKVVILTLAFVMIFSATAFADIGPKPKVTIYVENAPDETYYLDLLTDREYSSKYKNIDGEDDYNSDIIDMLYCMSDDGWYPAYADGTAIPIFGKLTGDSQNGKMVHTFSYSGVPDTYKIIIASESGKVIVTDTIRQKSLQASMTLDADDISYISDKDVDGKTIEMYS